MPTGELRGSSARRDENNCCQNFILEMDALQNLYAQVNQEKQLQQWPQQQWPQEQAWSQAPHSQHWSHPQQGQWLQQPPASASQWAQQHFQPSPYAASSSPLSSSYQQFKHPQEQPMYDDGFRAYTTNQASSSARIRGGAVTALPPAIPLSKRLSDAIVPLPTAIKGAASSQHIQSTLTEPVSATLVRDAKRVANNLQQMIIPSNNRADPAQTLRNCDLWGPFFFIITLSCVLSSTASSDKSTVFAVVFAVLSAGAVSLTMNVVLLGGKLNFFQSLSVLGYCLFPLNIGAILSLVSSSKLYRSFVVLLALSWSSWSVYPFISTVVRPSRKALAVYPVFLMYISVGFLVLANE